MKLTDREIELEPSTVEDNREYLLKLAVQDKFNRTDLDKLTEGLKLIRYIWVGRAHGIRGGIVFICFIPSLNFWTLDAYKEDHALRLVNTQGDFSFRAATLVIDWFFKTHAEDLYTIHRVENRGATIVCKRLGFEIVAEYSYFVTLRKAYGT